MKQQRNRTSRLVLSIAAIAGSAGILMCFLKNDREHPDTYSDTETPVVIGQPIAESTEKTAGYEEPLYDETEKSDTSASITEETFSIQETTRLQHLPAGEFAAAGRLADGWVHSLFFASPVDDTVSARINGRSYTENPNIRLSDLSYLKMLYYGFDGNTYIGEMIVNKKIESKVLEIFQTLYENEYPIEQMVLIDTYDADDTLSMEQNNTSAFNYRTIAGSSKLSNHSYGMAIDLNPKYNPYVKTASDGSIVCQPESGRKYADRTKEFAGKIDETDLAYRLFTEAGFTWGGSWNSVKDYQHFEMADEG